MSILSYIFVMQMGCCHVQAAFTFLLGPTIVFCICTHQNILSTSSNTQHIIHIPFYPPRESPSPTLQVENEMKMRAAQTMASASMGCIISLGKELVSAEIAKEFSQDPSTWCVQLNDCWCPCGTEEISNIPHANNVWHKLTHL